MILATAHDCIYAQVDFNKFYKDSDPAREVDVPIQKKAVHTQFLKKSISSSDTLKIILGHLYLSNDLVKETDYTTSMDHLLEAERFAMLKKDTLLLGRINHKKGAIYSILRDYPKAIENYQMALSQSEIAKDSQYIAISLEQLGRRFSNMNQYEKSNEYYRKAIPMVRNHCPPNSLSTTYINFGNSLDEQDSVSRAIEMYNMAIKIGEEIHDDYEIYPAKQNLALVYSKNGKLEDALTLYYDCAEANLKNGWLDYLIYSYDGLALTYEKMGKMDSAYHYFQKFHFLKDSVIGAEVNTRIKELEAESKIQKKNYEIFTQKEKSFLLQQKLKNSIIVGLLLCAVISWIAWFFYLKSKKSKLRLIESRTALSELIHVLAKKNAELRNLNVRINNLSSRSPLDEIPASIDDVSFYDMNILTEEDWITFKRLFERSYPNFLQRIREEFPDISPAEERMFLFIKLRISRSESANILGVQPESIKKTRTRLKKRLGLEQGVFLNDFIQNFA